MRDDFDTKLIMLQQTHDHNTRLFGNFFIFSGMYDAGLNDPILYKYVI